MRVPGGPNPESKRPIPRPPRQRQRYGWCAAAVHCPRPVHQWLRDPNRRSRRPRKSRRRWAIPTAEPSPQVGHSKTRTRSPAPCAPLWSRPARPRLDASASSSASYRRTSGSDCGAPAAVDGTHQSCSFASPNQEGTGHGQRHATDSLGCGLIHLRQIGRRHARVRRQTVDLR